MKNSFKKTIANVAKTGAIIGGLVLGGYHFSEKIGYVKHNVQKELQDNLGRKEILKDQETNDIIKLMSGIISQNEFDVLLSRHGYENDSLKINTLIEPDSAMYKTILEMQTKYGNPKISFSGYFKNLETGENEPNRPRFNWRNNTIKSHQLDSVLIDFDNIKDKEKFRLQHISGMGGLRYDTWQKYLLNNWIAELAHAKQLVDDGVIKLSINNSIDYMRSGFNYDKTYEIPGTVEFEAHKINELKLAQEFIQTYEKYAGKDSIKSLRVLTKLNLGFFDKFVDEDNAYSYLKIMEKKGDKLANYLLGKIYFDEYNLHFGYKIGYGITSLPDGKSQEKIFGKYFTPERLFREALYYYKKAYFLGEINAGAELIDISNNYRRGENQDIVIEVGEDILKNHIHEVDKTIIGNIYQKLGSIYYHQGDSNKGDEYLKLCDSYGGGYDYGF